LAPPKRRLAFESSTARSWKGCGRRRNLQPPCCHHFETSGGKLCYPLSHSKLLPPYTMFEYTTYAKIQVTSFQGKTLSEIYPKSNEFHASRRSWYLPISPSPDHPDASSKKTRKRFPSLDLAGGATLRWDSYVNIRHVYKTDWAHLRIYSNPETPERQIFRFGRESVVRLVVKGKALTNYEPGPQYAPRPRALLRVDTERAELSRDDIAKGVEPVLCSPKSDADTASVVSSEYSSLSPILQSDFGTAIEDDARSSFRPPKAPPDGKERWVFVRRILWCLLKWPLMLTRHFLARFRRKIDLRDDRDDSSFND
jgi:hypothetical protein